MKFCKFLSKRQTAVLTTITSFHVDEFGKEEVVKRIREFAVGYAFRTERGNSRMYGGQRLMFSYPLRQ